MMTGIALGIRKHLMSTVLIAILIVLCGCATPVGVSRISTHGANRVLTQNVLSTGRHSAFSQQVLARLSLAYGYRSDPEKALAEIHAGLGGPDEHARLFVLAELSFEYAKRSGGRTSYLACAVYAYAFLFCGIDPVSPYDPRLRLAMDLYNRAITEGLRAKKGRDVQLHEQTLSLPFGRLELTGLAPDVLYGGYHLKKFQPLTDFRVRGLRNRYRRPGIGVALTAQTALAGDGQATQWMPPGTRVPVTAFVRFKNLRAALETGVVSGKVELYDADIVLQIAIDNHTVALEDDPSAALAVRLEGAPIWDFEFAGFRKGDFNLLKDDLTGVLTFFDPYVPGRIPVVFVHGTASSPARWAEMLNELLGDPAIVSRYQFWFFTYNTGNPITFSAMHLREQLQEVLADVDSQSAHAALRRMIIIGHSQGGLLTKMTVVSSGTRFWDDISLEPFEQVSLKDKTRDVVRRSKFVEPLPFVERVVFIATPHRGSYRARGILGKIARSLVSLPARVTNVGLDLIQLDPAGAAQKAVRMPTSIDNMDPASSFIQTLASLPVDDGVQVNSIIPVKGTGPIEQGKDGVVSYSSAHLEGVESELVVRSEHSTQSNPQTIEEVRRILYRHVGIYEEAAAQE
jgi:pimeloyl-ACP methyl ester carboxylesterase